MPSPTIPTRAPAPAGDATNDSITLEVLGTLEIHSTLSALESRLDSMEIDLARAHGDREDDARRIAGEMAVMKARVEDALDAFAQTAEELRGLARGAEAKIDDVIATRLDGEHPSTAVLRTELRAGIDGVMAGVGDVLESVSREAEKRIDGLGAQMAEIQTGMLKIAEHVGALAPVVRRVDELEGSIAALRDLLETR